MKPSDKQLEAARDLIAEACASRAVSFAEISRLTGIDPSQVSRICRGEFKTFSPSVMQICTFLGVSLDRRETEGGDTDVAWERVQSSMRRIWDETPEGAMAIIRMLDAIAELRAKREG